MSTSNYIDFRRFQPLAPGAKYHRSVRMQRRPLVRRCSSLDGKHKMVAERDHWRCSACKVSTYHATQSGAHKAKA